MCGVVMGAATGAPLCAWAASATSAAVISRDRVDVLPQHLGWPHAQEVFGLGDDAADNLRRWLHGMDQPCGVACAHCRDADIASGLGGLHLRPQFLLMVEHLRLTAMPARGVLIVHHPIGDALREGRAQRQVIDPGQDGVVGARGDDALPGLHPPGPLRAGHEARAQPDTVCPQHQHGGQAPPIRDPARGDDRNRADGVDHGRDQG